MILAFLSADIISHCSSVTAVVFAVIVAFLSADPAFAFYYDSRRTA